MNQAIFEYTRKAMSIRYNGNMYDSALELKYALMIEDTHAFLREGIEIYYVEDTLEPALFNCFHKYEPDFLIRNRETNKPTLVEIKPAGYNNYEELSLRQKVANHFIEYFGYDWEFKVIYGNQIILTPEQERKYHYIIGRHKKYHREPFYFESELPLSEQDYTVYVRSGILSSLVP